MVPGQEKKKKQGKPQGEVFGIDLKYYPGVELQFGGLCGGQDLKGVGKGEIPNIFKLVKEIKLK